MYGYVATHVKPYTYKDNYNELNDLIKLVSQLNAFPPPVTTHSLS